MSAKKNLRKNLVLIDAWAKDGGKVEILAEEYGPRTEVRVELFFGGDLIGYGRGSNLAVALNRAVHNLDRAFHEVEWVWEHVGERMDRTTRVMDEVLGLL